MIVARTRTLPSQHHEHPTGPATSGWIVCGQQPVKCAKDTVAAGKGLAPVHQLWMMNQVNQLIWPSRKGIGLVNTHAWNRTVKLTKGGLGNI